MKLNYSFSILFAIFIINSGIAQQINYRTLKSAGVTPLHISKSAIEKNTEREITTSPYRPRKERTAEMDFYSSSTYAINELLVSGDVLYGDETHAYLENILNHILESNQIDKKINIHAVKSSAFNAFAVQDPVIFVNLGLLASVRNEAELAFVICHELAHHFYNHNVEGFLESYKVENMKEYRTLSSYDKILKKHSYSRNMEFAADSLGLIYFKKTKYHLPSAVTVFDLMSATHELFTFADINSSLGIENHFINLKKEKVDSLDKIHLLEEKESEELSTHPESSKRMEAIKKAIGSDADGLIFIQSEEAFKNVQMLAELESLRMCIIEGDEYKGYLLGHIILKKYSQYELYARKQIIKSMIGLLDRKIPSGSDRKIEMFEERIRSESENRKILYYYLTKTEQEIIDEISKSITDTKSKYPDDEELLALNNWFIKKLETWNKEKRNLSTNLSLEVIKKYEFSGKKKIFTDPYFLSIDFRKEYMLDYVKTENELIKVGKNMKAYNSKKENYHILSSADKANLTSEILFEKDIITKRLIEISNTPEGKLTPFPADYHDLNEICLKYDSQTTTVTFAATAYYKASSGAGVALLIFFAPLGIFYMSTPNYITISEYKEFDLISGEIKNEKYLQKKSKFSGSPMREIYFPKQID